MLRMNKCHEVFLLYGCRDERKRFPDGFAKPPPCGWRFELINGRNKKGFLDEEPDFICGAPGEIRTPDRLVRSQVLYPAELRARISK
jgi:hypothetical protein